MTTTSRSTRATAPSREPAISLETTKTASSRTTRRSAAPSNRKVSLTATRDSDDLAFSLADAPFGDGVTIATLNRVESCTIEMKVSKPIFTNTSDFKNHGDYVKSMGGGADAAHSCIGMPINSSK